MALVLALLLAAGCVQSQLSPVERARNSQSLDSTEGLIVPTALADIVDLGVSPCTRLVGTSAASGMQIDAGCRSPQRGIAGRLVPVTSAEQVRGLFEAAQTDGYNRVAVIPASLLTRELLEAVNAAAAPEITGEGSTSGSPGATQAGLAGVITLLDRDLAGNAIPPPYSSAATDGTPTGLDSSGSVAWNSGGRGIIGGKVLVPVVAASGDAAASAVRLTAANGARADVGVARWGALFRYYMGPSALTADSCLSRGQCLPLGGYSAWASLGGDVDDVGSEDGRRPGQQGWTLLAARADATAFFHGRARGVASGLGNIVVVTAAAAALAAEPSVASLPLRPLVSLFAAETAGRVGSRRWVREAVNGVSCEEASVASKSPYGRRGCLAPAVRADALSLPAMGLAGNGSTLASSPVGSAGGQGLAAALVVELPATNKSLQAGSGQQPFFVHQTRSGSAAQRRVRDVLSLVAQGMTGPLLQRPQGLQVRQGFRSAADPNAQASDARLVLPPSPLSTLLDARDAGASLSARLAAGGSAVVSGADTDAGQVTAALHGAGDDGSEASGALDAAALTDAATLVARAMYALGAGSNVNAAAAVATVPAPLRASSSFVAALLECLLRDAACALAQNVTGLDSSTLLALSEGSGGGQGDWGGGAAQAPPPLFPGVFVAPVAFESGGTAVSPNWLALLLRSVLADATANLTTTPTACSADSDCTKAGLPARVECVASVGLCGRTAAHFHEALSPAVRVTGSDPYGIDPALLTDEDPAWVEPYWSARIRTQLLLLPPAGDGGALLGAGVVVFVLAAGVVWYWTTRGRKAWKIE